ncbi:MAG TPA: winged helix-turn-helix transcriptional regulator, partial [bacterium]|nr:winged helix-turn-helix transcriptional regulator [bacterium]
TKKVPEKVPERVTVNQKKIIGIISQDARITIEKIARSVGISERKTKSNIAKLKEKGLLRRIGPDKGGYWEIVRLP